MLRDRRLPEKPYSTSLQHPACHCLPRQEKPHLCIFFFCFRVVFPPRNGHKAAPECRCRWAGAPVLPGTVAMCQAQAQPGHSPRSSCRVDQTPLSTALMFVISARNYSKRFSYLCLCKSVLSRPTEISCEAQGSLALPKRCGVFLWSKVHPGAYKPHCWFFIYL